MDTDIALRDLIWGQPGGHRPQPQGPLLGPLLPPQISIKRKVSIYTILQGIIQQEGELDEECVQTLVNLASREMRDIQEVCLGLGRWTS